MTKLTRLTGKIFGETATATGNDPEIGQFGSALAGTYNGTTNVATIQSLPAWSNGFIGAVTPTNQYPPLPEMTGFGKVLSHQICYLLQQGMPEWDSATTYYENGFCSYAGIIYKSLVDNNLNNIPEVSPTVWSIYGIVTDYANQSLTNLTTLGNARLQYAPFAINSGTVNNGENATLHMPEGSQVQIETAWIQPILNADGTMGGAAFAVSANAYNGANYVYKAVDGSTSTSWQSNMVSANCYYEFYNPDALKVTKLTFLNAPPDPYSYASTSGYVQGSDDGTTWTTIKNYTNTVTGNNQTWYIDLSDNATFYKYYRIYSTQNSQSLGWVIRELTITATYMATVSASTTIICDGCIVTSCDGRTLVQNDATIFDITTEADGDYYIFKNCINGNLSLISSLALAKTAPATPTDNDYWLDFSIIPANLKYYDTSDWVIDNDLVYIGDCTITSSAVTAITNREFNKSGYPVQKVFSTDYVVPDWANKIDITSITTTYTCPSDGILHIQLWSNGNQYTGWNSSLHAGINYFITKNDNNEQNAEFTVQKGEVLTFAMKSTYSASYFVPMKGAN